MGSSEVHPLFDLILQQGFPPACLPKRVKRQLCAGRNFHGLINLYLFCGRLRALKEKPRINAKWESFNFGSQRKCCSESELVSSRSAISKRDGVLGSFLVREYALRDLSLRRREKEYIAYIPITQSFHNALTILL